MGVLLGDQGIQIDTIYITPELLGLTSFFNKIQSAKFK
jgi:hypothetical protein